MSSSFRRNAGRSRKRPGSISERSNFLSLERLRFLSVSSRLARKMLYKVLSTRIFKFVQISLSYSFNNFIFSRDVVQNR